MLDNSLLTAKALEYMGRSIVAQKKNDKALERTCCLKAILMERLMGPQRSERIEGCPGKASGSEAIY